MHRGPSRGVRGGGEAENPGGSGCGPLERGLLEAGPHLGVGRGLGSGRQLWGRPAAGAMTSVHDWVFMNERNPVRE